MTSLVIVESPAKARTIAGYLGGDFVVESSIGHIRDLPNRASDVPKEQRERYGKLGVDVDREFDPYYVVDADKKRVVSDLKQKLRDADELLLATDEDREGEAIAWHLREVLKPKVPVRRMVFHEITRDAIRRALDETRDIDERLVDAQETRRILDRLYGFEVSPVLWKKVMPRLSAGRVQSVATRLVVDRERERMRFVAASYWDIVGTFEPGSFEARLVAVGGTRIAQGRDFGETGAASGGLLVLDEERARAIAAGLDGRTFTVGKVDEKPYTRRPAAPFRTSTLQQEASRKLRFSSQTTMSLAQRLYENGHITYMRTDSVTLSDAALKAARAHAARELRAGDRSRRAAPLRARGRQRAGSPRGDPAGRGRLPHARRARARAQPRPARALRPDLQADDRLADEGRGGPDGLDRARRDHGRRHADDLPRERHRDHVPGLHARLRVGPRRARRGGRGAPPAGARGGRRS